MNETFDLLRLAGSRNLRRACAAILVLAASGALIAVGAADRYPRMPKKAPPAHPVAGSEAEDEASMLAYTEEIPGTGATFEMVPVRGGSFLQGSPPGERGRKSDEGPQRAVRISPFWMGRTEVRWDEFDIFMLDLDDSNRRVDQDRWADAVSRPTPPYTPMDFGMGHDGYPAISMTQLAARQYTRWLTMKTGRFHRLPTEAEWEYACRAGTDTAWSFGKSPTSAEEYAWFAANSNRQYAAVGRLEPNPWGLFDMHGNVAEWTLDALVPYAPTEVEDPFARPSEEYGRVIRGGSFRDPVNDLRCAARRASSASWKRRDPQLPQSIWYLTNADFVGFRVVRPLDPPPYEEWDDHWRPDTPSVLRIYEAQRRGER